MRILHAISSVNPTGGGPIEGLKQLARVADANGHKIEVATLDSPDAEFLTEFPAPVYPLGPSKSTYRYAPKFVPWLRANMASYDVVVVNGIWQYNSFGVRRALRNSSTPYVVFTHGMLDPWFKRAYPLKHVKKWLYWPWGEYRVLRDAAAVLFTCEEERRLASHSFGLYSANERVVNYGTAEPAGDRQSQIEKVVATFPSLQGKRLVLFIGRIHPKKGCDLALRAFAATLASDPSWHLVMAGPDQIGWRSSLESLAGQLQIADRVTWTGMVAGDLKWGLIRSSEIMFLPSHQENFGIVVAEALACGLPVLISNKVNIWREIQTDGAGIVAPDDLQGASELLHRWNGLDADDRDAMRHRARACFDRRFEINRTSASYFSMLEELSSAKRAGGPSKVPLRQGVEHR